MTGFCPMELASNELKKPFGISHSSMVSVPETSMPPIAVHKIVATRPNQLEQVGVRERKRRIETRAAVSVAIRLAIYRIVSTDVLRSDKNLT